MVSAESVKPLEALHESEVSGSKQHDPLEDLMHSDPSRQFQHDPGQPKEGSDSVDERPHQHGADGYGESQGEEEQESRIGRPTCATTDQRGICEGGGKSQIECGEGDGGDEKRRANEEAAGGSHGLMPFAGVQSGSPFTAASLAGPREDHANVPTAG